MKRDMEELEEGTGESSPPANKGLHSAYLSHQIKNEIYTRLVESGNKEALSNPSLREELDDHFSRLPQSYALDVHVDRAEDVLLHRDILVQCRDPEKRPIFHARFLRYVQQTPDDENDDDESKQSQCVGSSPREYEIGVQNVDKFPNPRGEFEPCTRLEDLNLGFHNTEGTNGKDCTNEVLSARKDAEILPLHEIIFSSIDKPKLLSQLSALLSDLDLNIREAHVFSTSDGFCLDVFVVDGWPDEETEHLLKRLKEIASRKNLSLSGKSHISGSDKLHELLQRVGDSDIDRKMLHIGEKIASGSSGDLYHGTYHGHDVAIKFLRSEHLNNSLEVEFLQEVSILRNVDHANIVRFFGACTNRPDFCIVTEYMPGGNLYDYLHKDHNKLDLPQILKIAIDVSKGMNYLHQHNIIHRDLKSANLLIDSDQVVKVADFGVARLGSQLGDMTAETGTYRWMAPEVINHKPYDHKADVFSFAIVLWELATSKVPYDNLTPLQAALGVRQGMRPEIPSGLNPRLVDLMKRCWDDTPNKRPSFSDITLELETLLQQIQKKADTGRKNRSKMPKKSQR
ncbi:hypothetical protein LUZ62_037762 [Rhynchospora pubera]|uniref:non-specific serine/threonine protein kinase n=1 Tax=Rhynchospora pubera TaxID=906938 RepID=A0AAV8F447_9POAL|nr:hypothetical protein LUZ62_037762 [Rhynchospora pubera]